MYLYQKDKQGALFFKLRMLVIITIICNTLFIVFLCTYFMKKKNNQFVDLKFCIFLYLRLLHITRLYLLIFRKMHRTVYIYSLKKY